MCLCLVCVTDSQQAQVSPRVIISALVAPLFFVQFMIFEFLSVGDAMHLSLHLSLSVSLYLSLSVHNSQSGRQIV